MEVEGGRGCEYGGACLPELVASRGEKGGELAVEGLVEVGASAKAEECEEFFIGQGGQSSQLELE